MPTAPRRVPTYCSQCVAGPDLLTVKVAGGVATEIEPNFQAADIHPAEGKVCVKAYGLVQKLYNPHRILTPMKRTNPNKGKNQDPGFVPVSWDEALDLVAGRLNQVRETGLLDGSGFPRVAVSFGGGGTPASYMGTFPAFLAAWGPLDFSYGSGQGVKCTHSEHLYGELWHRGFTVCPDTPLNKYVVSFGANTEAAAGVCGVHRHAQARADGAKRVQIEPHLSVTGACSAEWIPIKPQTDAAFLFAMLHVLLHQHGRERLDLPFLRDRTASPYLVGPNGFFLRQPDSGKPLVWDLASNTAMAHDTPGIQPALEGRFTVAGHELGADDQRWQHDSVEGATAFTRLVEHVAGYSPEWAAGICDVPAATIRRIAGEYLDHAQIGATVEIEGQVLPLRPVSINLGKSVNNGWGGYECCWARTLLACLIGGLEVPGGMLGTMVRLNRPAGDRLDTVRHGEDGFLAFPWNETDREHWAPRPHVRSGHRTLVPLSANSPWSQALGPTHLAWKFMRERPDNWPETTPPDVWIVYRTNPAISFWDTPNVSATMARLPFVVCFAYTHDETNHMADVLLPERTDLEGLQLIRIGGTRSVEQFWDHQGFALRQPVVEPLGQTQDFTWIATELARRTGLLEKYNNAINRGAAGVPLSGKDAAGQGWDHRLDPGRAHGVEDIWDAACKSASAELGGGSQGLEWFRSHGYKVGPFSRLGWYLYPSMVEHGLRFEMPFQERLLRVGRQLANRLHEAGIDWWDVQLTEYQALPAWKDFPGLWEKVLVKHGRDPADFPFWLITSRSMQYAWGGNVGVQMIREVAGNLAGHDGVILNAGLAARLGIKEGDRIEVASHIGLVQGRAVPRQGIRPDTLLMIGQFSHWKTPLAKDFDTPSMNALTPMDLDLTDATGSGADVVRVSLRKL